MNQDKEEVFNELFKAKEIINSEIHKNKRMENSFSKFGFINTTWYKDYLHFLKKPNKDSNYEKKLFKYELLHPKNDKRDYTYIGRSTFSFPSDFVFVTQNFVNLISKYIYTYDKYYYEKFKEYLFEIAIGGDCIIMKNFVIERTENMYIIIYEENKGNMNNNIDFILMIDDYSEMKKALNFILENSIWIYLKNISFSIEEDEKEIINDKGEKIGYISRNGELNRKKEVKEIQKMKNENIKATQKMIPKFNSILMCLYLSNIFLQELSKFSLDNKKKITKIFVEYFQNFNIHKIKPIFSRSIKIDLFEYIFEEIFVKLDSELSKENEYKVNNGQNDQSVVFKEQYKNGSIIKRLFYYPQEIKKFCPYCLKTYYKYKYKKIILLKSIDTKNENFLFEKIFKPEEIEKRERCKLCNLESKCINSKSFILFPKILIILIKEDQIGKINLKKEIKNDKGISYELYCIIEENTNMVYFKNEFDLWLRCGENKREDIESKTPIVLFYRLMNIKNNMRNKNNNNQIQNNNINFNQNLMINNMNNMNNNMNGNNLNENYMNINNVNNKEKENLNNMSNNYINNNDINNSFTNNMNRNYINMNNHNNLQSYNLNNINSMNMNMNNSANNLNRNNININMNNNYNLNSNNLNNMNNNNMNNNNMMYINRNIMNINSNNLNNMNNNNINGNNMNLNNINMNSGNRNNINQLNQINNIESQEIDSKRQIFELNREIERLRYELEKEKNINKYLEENMKIKEILLNEKDAEISKLKLRYPFELSEGEKLISITLISFDELIQYSIICKNTHKFGEIENMFYNKYIEYKNKKNIFLIKGKRINSNKTLEENNIKNGDVIYFKVIK